MALSSCNLNGKITDARIMISKLLGEYKNPIVMSSFGKDSLVLLDILKRSEIKLPILFHREPFFPDKYTFANKIILEENYVVYDYTPSSTFIVKNGEKMEIVSCYQSGEYKGDKTPYACLPTGIKEPVEGKPCLCGYQDIYKKPTGMFNFPWDVCLVGHKSSDVDPIMGDVPLLVDVRVVENGADYAFPLRHFTDSDVWEYITKYNVEFDDRRYDPKTFKEVADITYNPDYFHACTKCIDKDSGPTVYCPKLSMMITNISNSLRYHDPVRPSYIGEEKDAIRS